MTVQWPLLRVDDLKREDIEVLLAFAEGFRTGASPPRAVDATVGLLFFEPSLRTRVGFAAAAHRLGARPIDILARRAGPDTSPESLDDALRVLAGYVDVVVARPGVPFERDRVQALCPRPLISAGDAGRLAEHPTQAMIDLFAMRALAGRTGPWSVAICGDPRMRSARSLLHLLHLTGDAATITLVTDPAYIEDDSTLLDWTCSWSAPGAAPWGSFDVVYVTGMAHASLPLDARSELIVDRRTLDELPPHALVLSPMPVIDEVAYDARSDPRVRFHDQSDLGLFVRMAVLSSAFDLCPGT